MLISHYNHLMAEEGVGFRETIVRGSMERLTPILMTALVAGVDQRVVGVTALAEYLRHALLLEAAGDEHRSGHVSCSSWGLTRD